MARRRRAVVVVQCRRRRPECGPQNTRCSSVCRLGGDDGPAVSVYSQHVSRTSSGRRPAVSPSGSPIVAAPGDAASYGVGGRALHGVLPLVPGWCSIRVAAAGVAHARLSAPAAGGSGISCVLPQRVVTAAGTRVVACCFTWETEGRHRDDFCALVGPEVGSLRVLLLASRAAAGAATPTALRGWERRHEHQEEAPIH